MHRTYWRCLTRVTSGILALGIALVCAFAIATSPPADASVSRSADTSTSGDATRLNLSAEAAADNADLGSGVSRPAVLSGMCHGVCASHSAATCQLVVVLASVSLLGLLLNQQRDTYLGLTARRPARPRPSQTDRQRPPRWTVLTLTELCVLRV